MDNIITKRNSISGRAARIDITSIDITDRALVQMARQIMYIPVIYYYTNDKGQVRHSDEMNIVV
jgi:hypothetical protein